MQLASQSITRVCSDREIYEEVLDLDGKYLIELGCGAADHTRAIAAGGMDRTIIAFEVDAIQHAKNLASERPSNVAFRYGGAEAIDCDDASADAVFMFKSLHHIPIGSMPRALEEIARVLKPSGHAYISEPIFAGAFNDIIRLFHDEQAVREAAFDAVRIAVERGLFELESEIFFRAPVSFKDFTDFEERIIRATHTDHRLSRKVYEEVRTKFARHPTPSGAYFEAPMRVDVLIKPRD
ncbi:MAG: class I SAM-dependent methyltransferase [Pseudomonadota bacterium]|nr:class I SAM-dependent methyltransferase [Pseudomonadota bacterium]